MQIFTVVEYHTVGHYDDRETFTKAIKSFTSEKAAAQYIDELECEFKKSQVDAEAYSKWQSHITKLAKEEYINLYPVRKEPTLKNNDMKKVPSFAFSTIPEHRHEYLKGVIREALEYNENLIQEYRDNMLKYTEYRTKGCGRNTLKDIENKFISMYPGPKEVHYERDKDFGILESTLEIEN